MLQASRFPRHARLQNDSPSIRRRLELDAICYCLECYTKALSQKNFDLWYVDVFAGPGRRTNENSPVGCWSASRCTGQPLDARAHRLGGSCIVSVIADLAPRP